jgi:hypothetical protein
MRTFRFLPLLTLMLALTAVNASANTITVGPTPIVIGGGPFTWAYGVTLDGNSQINNGDFFTIFDFDGYINGTQSANAGWNATSSNLGTCPTDVGFPALCSIFDDPALPNLTWTRTGGTIMGPGSNNPAILLGIFSAQSIYDNPRNDGWVSQDQDNQTGTANEGAGGNTNVPFATPVPEPASLLLLGSGLAFVARMRKRKTA